MSTHGKRRALGQHFLKDAVLASSIADYAIQKATELNCKAVLEIGPGRGALTFPILQALGKLPEKPEFILCEKDYALAQYWREAHQNVKEYDFLDLPDAEWLSQVPVAIVSNLPYSVGTPIVSRLARKPGQIPFMILMFQAEVAQRLRAEQGTKAWGSMSVWIQNYWTVEKFASVPPRAFQPPPEVDSEVVTLVPRENPFVAIDQEKDPGGLRYWEPLLKTCFAHRRKMLRSGLPGSGPWRNALEVSGVDGTKRSEALSWNEWQKLYLALIRA